MSVKPITAKQSNVFSRFPVAVVPPDLRQYWQFMWLSLSGIQEVKNLTFTMVKGGAVQPDYAVVSH